MIVEYRRCASSIHAELIESSKGASFVLCRLSYEDPRFARYPRLPVLACDGHAPHAVRSTDTEGNCFDS